MSILFALALLAGAPRTGGELEERLREAPTFTFTTAKAPEDLEYCIGDALSRMGAPAALRDGPNRTVMLAWSFDKVMGVVDVRREGAGSRIAGHIRFGSWQGRMRDAVGRCAG